MDLLLVRHAESEGNATGNYSALTADSLSCEGQRQAQQLAGALRGQPFDRIIVSPLQRAMETIEPYLKATRQQAEIWPELAEACWHDERDGLAASWQSQPATITGVSGSCFSYRNDEAIRPTVEESFGAGLRRIHEAESLLVAEAHQQTQSLLAVAHGHFIRELLNILLATRTLDEFPHDNCGMTSLTFDGRWHLNFCNCSEIQIEPSGE